VRVTTLRLVVVWGAVALALQTWGGLTGHGAPTRPLGAGDIVLARPPVTPILTLWVCWQAPPAAVGWVVLEPDGIQAAPSDLAYWRRRVNPGWNQLTWDDFSRFPPERPVRVRVLEGEGTLRVTSAVPSSWYGFGHLRPLRGLVAALLVGAVAAGVLGYRRLQSAPWERPGSWHLAVLAIAAGALALRIYTLTTQSFWFDEVLTAIGAQSFAWVLYSAQIFGHPPLQYLVAWAAGGAAATEGAVRAPFVAAGVGAVLVMALLGRRVGGPATGLLAAGLLAVSPFHVELSQLARPYAFVVLTVALSWLALFRALEGCNVVDWLAFSAAAALAFYTHYLGGMVVVIQALVAGAWVVRRGGTNGLPALVSLAGVGLLIAPWLEMLRPLAGAQLDRGVLSAAALGDFVTHVLIPEQVGSGVAGLVTGALCLLGLRGLGSRPEIALAAVLSPTLPIGVLWAINPAQALAGRHFAFVLPMVMLLVAHGLVTAARLVEAAFSWRPRVAPTWTRRGVAAATAVALIVASHLPAGAVLGGYYQWRHGTDWRTVAAVLDRLVGPDDEVLATLGAVYPLRYYWRPTVDETDAERLRARFRSTSPARRAWLVTIEGWDWAPELHQWLAAHATRVGEVPPAWSRQRVYIHVITPGRAVLAGWSDRSE
jgi:dolichyl-phosphate-mannose-protein mannosyltransferase